jgi:hypothetical protein
MSNEKVFTLDDIKGVMDQYPLVNRGGAIKPSRLTGTGYKSLEELEAKWLLSRQGLMDPSTAKTIFKVCAWLQVNTVYTKKLNRMHDSYGWKHIVEKETDYGSNGEFIVAALLCGYEMQENEYNPAFNMKLTPEARVRLPSLYILDSLIPISLTGMATNMFAIPARAASSYR